MKELYEGLAEVFEVDSSLVDREFSLIDHGWDSLAVISTMALVDDLYGIVLNGHALMKCAKVADIEALVSAKNSV